MFVQHVRTTYACMFCKFLTWNGEGILTLMERVYFQQWVFAPSVAQCVFPVVCFPVSISYWVFTRFHKTRQLMLLDDMLLMSCIMYIYILYIIFIFYVYDCVCISYESSCEFKLLRNTLLDMLDFTGALWIHQTFMHAAQAAACLCVTAPSIRVGV